MGLEIFFAFHDVTFTYRIIMSILAISLAIATIEDLRVWEVFSTNGILSWRVSRLGVRWTIKSSISNFMNFILEDKVFKFGTYLKLLFSVFLFVNAVLNTISPVLVLFLFLLNILITLRSPYGLDGAYQMQLVILFALCIGSFCGMNSPISKICLWFIGGQLLLSYFIAGVTKLMSPLWRKDAALRAIFGTKTFGHPFLYKMVSKSKVLAMMLSWSIFLFELLFFLTIFFHPAYAITFLVGGVLFHLCNAIFMGLNDFLLTFSAAYPALIFCINQIYLNQ